MLAHHPFLSRADESARTEIFRAVSDAITSTPIWSDSLFVDLTEADSIDRRLLVERHLISRQHASGTGSRGVSVSRAETCAVMINEEDHLRIQVLRCGLRLEGLWEEIDEVDDALGTNLEFAFDQEAPVCETRLEPSKERNPRNHHDG